MTFREFTGKNVEEAIRAAMAEFSSDLGDLDIEILAQGSRSILGVGGEEARILAAPKSAVAAAETVRADAPAAESTPDTEPAPDIEVMPEAPAVTRPPATHQPSPHPRRSSPSLRPMRTTRSRSSPPPSRPGAPVGRAAAVEEEGTDESASMPSASPAAIDPRGSPVATARCGSPLPSSRASQARS